MAIDQNPFGLHTITPYLVVESVSTLIDFLQHVFDAESRAGANREYDEKTRLKLGLCARNGIPHTALHAEGLQATSRLERRLKIILTTAGLGEVFP